jgi:hypothetical protein
MLNTIMLSSIKMNKPNAAMLSSAILNGIIPNAIRLNVVSPIQERLTPVYFNKGILKGEVSLHH